MLYYLSMEKATEKILKENNLKITNGHKGVLELLIKEKHPLSIEEIKEKINLKINLTTIYRILEKFVEKGIIYQTNFRDGKSYFEFQDNGNHHHHVTCIKCDFRESIDVCVKSQIKKINFKNSRFSSIDSHILEFFSLCENCKKDS